MRLLNMPLLAASVSIALLAQTPPQGSTTLKVGDAAPDFTLPSTEKGVKVHLADYLGKSTVVLAFFPAAFTGG
jgi:peroxiredoxin